MSQLVFTIGAVIFGICLVNLANGFLGTLVSMETSAAGFDGQVPIRDGDPGGYSAPQVGEERLWILEWALA